VGSFTDRKAETKDQQFSSFDFKKKIDVAGLTRIDDPRQTTAAQGKLQKIANESPQIEQVAQLQVLANTRLTQQQTANAGPLQREAMVIVEDLEDYRVVISSDGEAVDFKGGSAAKNTGWNGVDKYRAFAKVGNNPSIKLGSTDNNYRVAQAGHILAAQNGGDGGDKDNVFAQDGGVNNGPFRSQFENPMRAQLDSAQDDEQVHFRVSLYGNEGRGVKITQGPLEKESDDLNRSDADSDFDDFDSDSS